MSTHHLRKEFSGKLALKVEFEELGPSQVGVTTLSYEPGKGTEQLHKTLVLNRPMARLLYDEYTQDGFKPVKLWGTP